MSDAAPRRMLDRIAAAVAELREQEARPEPALALADVRAWSILDGARMGGGRGGNWLTGDDDAYARIAPDGEIRRASFKTGYPESLWALYAMRSKQVYKVEVPHGGSPAADWMWASDEGYDEWLADARADWQKMRAIDARHLSDDEIEVLIMLADHAVGLHPNVSTHVCYHVRMTMEQIQEAVRRQRAGRKARHDRYEAETNRVHAILERGDYDPERDDSLAPTYEPYDFRLDSRYDDPRCALPAADLFRLEAPSGLVASAARIVAIFDRLRIGPVARKERASRAA